MNIFSNEKAVVGLFENDLAVEQALQALQSQELDSNAQVLNQHQLVNNHNQVVVPSPVTHSGAAPVMINPDETKENQIKRLAHDVLTNFGFDAEDANFFALHIGHGGHAIVVEVDEEQAPKVLGVFEKMDAQAKAVE